MKTVEYGKENQEIILLLHGGGLSWWNYKAVAERIADRIPESKILILKDYYHGDFSINHIDEYTGQLCTLLSDAQTIN